MSAELLGWKIVRKSDGKSVYWIGVKCGKKQMKEFKEKFPKSKYIFVEFRKIKSPKSSMYRYK